MAVSVVKEGEMILYFEDFGGDTIKLFLTNSDGTLVDTAVVQWDELQSSMQLFDHIPESVVEKEAIFA